MGDERLHVEVMENACLKCKYSNKCLRLKHIQKVLGDLESETLDKWRMDVSAFFIVSTCDLFVLDESVDGMDEWIEFEEDGGGRFE